jgi:hypothetical protein
MKTYFESLVKSGGQFPVTPPARVVVAVRMFEVSKLLRETWEGFEDDDNGTASDPDDKPENSRDDASPDTADDPNSPSVIFSNFAFLGLFFFAGGELLLFKCDSDKAFPLPFSYGSSVSEEGGTEWPLFTVSSVDS